DRQRGRSGADIIRTHHALRAAGLDVAVADADAGAVHDCEPGIGDDLGGRVRLEFGEHLDCAMDQVFGDQVLVSVERACVLNNPGEPPGHNLSPAHSTPPARTSLAVRPRSAASSASATQNRWKATCCV